MKVTNSEWDLGFKEELELLPTEIMIPEGIDEDDCEAIYDYFSNVTDYYHKGYNLEK